MPKLSDKEADGLASKLLSDIKNLPHEKRVRRLSLLISSAFEIGVEMTLEETGPKGEHERQGTSKSGVL
jgi:hypothetical protein